MIFAGLDEMIKLREKLRMALLTPISHPEPELAWPDVTVWQNKVIRLMGAQLDCQAGLILKLCHACDEREKEIDLLDSVLMQHKKRIAELEAWRKQNTGDGK